VLTFGSREVVDEIDVRADNADIGKARVVVSAVILGITHDASCVMHGGRGFVPGRKTSFDDINYSWVIFTLRCIVPQSVWSYDWFPFYLQYHPGMKREAVLWLEVSLNMLLRGLDFPLRDQPPSLSSLSSL